MRRGTQKLAVLTCVVALTAAVPALAVVYPISSFPRLQGVIVRSVAEDTEGVIWLGTDDGLWRWTGREFARAKSHLPEGTRVSDIALLPNGRLLLACADGLRAMDTQSQTFDAGFRILQNKHIYRIFVAPDGTVWLGAAHGLFRLSFTAGRAHAQIVQGAEALGINSIISDGASCLLAASEMAVLQITPNGPDVTPIFTSAIGKGRVITLANARDGSVWIGQRWPGQLTRITGSNVTVFGSADGLTNTEINDIIEYGDGEIWLATEGGLFRFLDGRFHAIDRSAGLPNQDTHRLFVDSEQQIWIGAFGHGVFRMRSPYVRTYMYEDGLAHPVVTSVRNGPAGTMIAGTVAGAVRLDPSRGIAETIGPQDHIKAVYHDDAGEIWLARYLDTVRLSDGRSFAASHTTQITQDSDGNLLMCSSPGPKRLVNDTLTTITVPEAAGTGCLSMAPDADGVLYIVTNDYELLRVSEAGNRVWLHDEPITSVVVGDDGRVLAGMRHGIFDVTEQGATPLIDRRGEPFLVRDFAKDAHGRFWAATDRGIARIDGKQVEWFDYEDGLPTHDIRSVAVGADGYLYAGTTQGLSRIDKNRLQPCQTKPRVTIEEVIAGTQRWHVGEPLIRAEYPVQDVVARVKTNGWRSCIDVRYQFQLLGRDAEWSEPTPVGTWHGTKLTSDDYTLLVKAVNQRGIESDVVRVPFSVLPPFWQGNAFRAACMVVAIALGGLVIAAIRRRRALRRALALTERAKREFVTRMSHELRTPLTVLIASADLIARETGNTPNQRENVRSVIRNGEHLLGVVNEILDLATLNEGHERIQAEPVNLPALLAEARDLTIRRVRGKDVVVVLTVDENVPHEVTTDPTKLRQILINLLDNASKFTEQGSITLHVAMAHHRGGGASASRRPSLQITVTDTGPGIAPDRQHAIFEAFEQNDSTKGRRHGGTGLGLTIARSLAVALGGGLTVTSELGSGSSFLITIPVTTAPEAARTVAAASPTTTDAAHGCADDATPGQLDGVRVALADDHDDVRRVLVLSLEELGATVSPFSSGAALVKCCIANPFDVVLIDIHMPETDGIATLHELRHHNVRVPALAVTADVTDTTSRECKTVGFVGVLTKPFRIADLVAAIQPLVRKSGTTTVQGRDASTATEQDHATQDHDDGVGPPLHSDLESLSPRLAEAAAKFVIHLGDDIDRLRVAARTRDETTLRDTAHRLKGAGGINGYFCVSDAATELEHAIIRRDYDATQALVGKIETLHTRMVNGLKSHGHRHKTN